MPDDYQADANLVQKLENRRKNTARSNAASTAVGNTFAALGINDDLSLHLSEQMNIMRPTGIQRSTLSAMVPQAHSDSMEEADRDVLIHAETGSGKTLAYLLPIVQRLLSATIEREWTAPPSRALGSLAIVLAPTRELAIQIDETLTKLLSMRHGQRQSAEDNDDNDDNDGSEVANGGSSAVRRHWAVPGLVIGGGNKGSEKARLRKGITILVSTPGRLLDHLKTTQSFCVDHLRWLVLDEADRLMDLGFEQTLQEIMTILGQRRQQYLQQQQNQKRSGSAHSDFINSTFLPKQRQTVLCSATLGGKVELLAGEALRDPQRLSAMANSGTKSKDGESAADTAFATPSQLKQSYVVTPAKQRLVTLVALLRNTVSSSSKSAAAASRPVQTVVFLSSCDSVDFHYGLLTKSKPEGTAGNDEFEDSDNEAATAATATGGESKKTGAVVSQQSPMLNGIRVFRLHGNLAQDDRRSTYTAFRKSREPSVLLTTDVSARGLDLPDVRTIIQYDPPTDVADYVHRVGRTARIGRTGEAILFLLPHEVEYLALLEQREIVPEKCDVSKVLMNAYGGDNASISTASGGGRNRFGNRQMEERASEVQDVFEKHLINDSETMTLASKAFLSHIRAYATHPVAERHIFHVKKLHTGHLAKAFALREAPKKVVSTVRKTTGTAKDGEGGKKNKTPAESKKDLARKRMRMGTQDGASEFGSGAVTKRRRK
ncbi:DEAD-domain-containing protein [Ramicandelaber brevisporus]|nr:DEAD-domain-containing protein [Ramicandelaber brevisporus]